MRCTTEASLIYRSRFVRLLIPFPDILDVDVPLVPLYPYFWFSPTLYLFVTTYLTERPL
jgi:hypothetical protein